MEDVIKKSTVARWRKTILEEKLCKGNILNSPDLLRDVLAKLAAEPALQVGCSSSSVCVWKASC
jgi:hypothetical protein